MRSRHEKNPRKSSICLSGIHAVPPAIVTFFLVFSAFSTRSDYIGSIFITPASLAWIGVDALGEVGFKNEGCGLVAHIERKCPWTATLTRCKVTARSVPPRSMNLLQCDLIRSTLSRVKRKLLSAKVFKDIEDM